MPDLIAYELLQLMRPQSGHFELASGHHGDLWLEPEAAFTEVRALRRFMTSLAKQLAAHRPDAICGPLIGGAFLVGFATIGGLLGVKFFEKRQGMPQDPYSPGGGGSWPNA